MGKFERLDQCARDVQWGRPRNGRRFHAVDEHGELYCRFVPKRLEDEIVETIPVAPIWKLCRACTNEIDLVRRMRDLAHRERSREGTQWAGTFLGWIAKRIGAIAAALLLIACSGPGFDPPDLGGIPVDLVSRSSEAPDALAAAMARTTRPRLEPALAGPEPASLYPARRIELGGGTGDHGIRPVLEAGYPILGAPWRCGIQFPEFWFGTTRKALLVAGRPVLDHWPDGTPREVGAWRIEPDAIVWMDQDLALHLPALPATPFEIGIQAVLLLDREPYLVATQALVLKGGEL